MLFEFNHSKETIGEAIGLPEKDFEDLENKYAEFTQNIYKKDIQKASQIIEQVLTDISYNDLVIISGLYFAKVIKDAKDDKLKRDLLSALLNKNP